MLQLDMTGSDSTWEVGYLQQQGTPSVNGSLDMHSPVLFQPLVVDSARSVCSTCMFMSDVVEA